MPNLTYGKDYNLLKFSDEALNAMSPEAAHAVIYATAQEAKEVMSKFGIGMDKLEAAWENDQEISVDEIRAAAQSLDSGLKAQGTSESQGQELLSFLGLKGDE
jgi:acetyl-CoA carboxylase alpha subunit